MKKSLEKIRIRRKNVVEKPTRITNDTIAEHREKILAGGRRYKYPVQYARHKLVFNAVIIAVASLVILVLLLWWQLYSAQSTSTYLYRITQALPLPVANVDGQYVRYSDYLLYERPSMYYIEKFGDQTSGKESGESQRNYVKRAALDRAIAAAYAKKVVNQKNISVSDEEVRQALNDLRSASNGTLSEEAINASAERNFGVTKDDVYRYYQNSLTVTKASFAIDDKAQSLKDNISRVIAAQSNSELKKIADDINSKEKDSVTYGVSGLVSIASITSGLRGTDVAKLEKGKLSGPLQSTTADGYFFIKVLEKTDSQVSYEFIQVPLKAMTSKMEQLRKDNKIKEYISIAKQ